MKELSKDFFFKLQRINFLGGPIKLYTYKDGRLYIFRSVQNDVTYESAVKEGSELFRTDRVALLSAFCHHAIAKYLWYPEYDNEMVEDVERWVDLFIAALEQRIREVNPLKDGTEPIIQLMPRDMTLTSFDYTVVFGETWFQGSITGGQDMALLAAKTELHRFISEVGQL